jgi:hypothetical protein
VVPPPAIAQPEPAESPDVAAFLDMLNDRKKRPSAKQETLAQGDDDGVASGPKLAATTKREPKPKAKAKISVKATAKGAAKAKAKCKSAVKAKATDHVGDSGEPKAKSQACPTAKCEAVKPGKPKVKANAATEACPGLSSSSECAANMDASSGPPRLMLGCSKCRGSTGGCGQCRNPAFKGRRYQK